MTQTQIDDIRGLSRVSLERLAIMAERLLEQSNNVLKLIPECPDHGPMCLPHYKFWIEAQLKEQQMVQGVDPRIEIPTREEIAAKLMRSEALGVKQAVERVVKLLNNTTTFPTTVAASAFGDTIGIQNVIVKKLKSSGWSVQYHSDKREGDYYTIS